MIAELSWKVYPYKAELHENCIFVVHQWCYSCADGRTEPEANKTKSPRHPLLRQLIVTVKLTALALPPSCIWRICNQVQFVSRFVDRTNVR